MLGKSNKSKPVSTNFGLVIKTSIPWSTLSSIQSSRLVVATDDLKTEVLSPIFEIRVDNLDTKSLTGLHLRNLRCNAKLNFRLV